MKEHIFELQVPENLSFEQVIKERNNGGKFVFFSYLIPRPWFSPVKRISKIYFLRSEDKASIHNRKYNIINLLWGWWGLPFGPVYTYAAIKSNKTGIDITDDVFDNLTEEDFDKRRVIIRKASNIFIHPSKSISKEFSRCFNKYSQKNSKFIEDPIVGYFIDTENPYYYIGLNGADLNKRESLKNELYKYFLSRTKFEFIDINESSVKAEKLKLQGKIITFSTDNGSI